MSVDTATAFFSYSREDSEFALRLAEELKSAGAKVWIDQLDIEPGLRWDEAVDDALNDCPRMLVILSPISLKSENVRDEVSFALGKQKRVIPILYRECEIPFRLARLQHIDFRTDYGRGLRLLLKALGVEQSMAAAAASLASREGKPAPTEVVTGTLAAEQHAAEKAKRKRVSSQKSTAEKSAAEEHTEQTRLEPVPFENGKTQGQLDDEWEAERKQREQALTRAVVDNWSTGGTASSPEDIRRLRSALDEWILQRPPDFESRQAKRLEQRQADTKRAVDSWRERTNHS